MDDKTESTVNIQPEHLFLISQICLSATEWKPALDEIVQIVRGFFIFDNLAVYLSNSENTNLDVMYARAVGRGRSAEADIAWGEVLASKVSDRHETILEEPQQDADLDRLERPYLLGLPLSVGSRFLGSIVLIRFGGPAFLKDDIYLAEFIAGQISMLIEHQIIHQVNATFEAKRLQMQMQEDFFSNISHELRTPLGFIKGYTTTLLRSDTSWDKSTEHEFLQIIEQETDHLQELINNLLDSSRLQSGHMQMKFQPVRLDALLNDTITQVRNRNSEIEIGLNLKARIIPIFADPNRLAQVFENLLNNAVKYAPGSKIIVKIRQAEDVSVVSIKDFGPGIPETYLPLIFDRFFRVPETPSTVHGSGLGLYICKQIIDAHQGKIHVESYIGGGTTFSVILPFSQMPDLGVNTSNIMQMEIPL